MVNDKKINIKLFSGIMAMFVVFIVLIIAIEKRNESFFGAGEVKQTVLIDKSKVSDEKLKIKADSKDDILASESIHEIGVKNYVYVSSVEVPKQKLNKTKKQIQNEFGKKKTAEKELGAISEEIDFKEVIDQPDEILSLRESNLIVYKLGTTTENKPVYQYEYIAGTSFYSKNGKWYEVEYATTTIVAWDLQIGVATGTSYWRDSIDVAKNYLYGIYPVNAACGDSGGDCYSGTGNGFCAGPGASTLWTTERDGTTAGSCYYGAAQTAGEIRGIKYSGNSKFYISRVWLPFDTSSLPNSITVTAASLYFSTYQNESGAVLYAGKSTVSSDTVLATSDWDNWESTDFGSITPGAAGDNKQLTLNADGRANVNPAGYSKYVLREGDDFTNTPPTSGNNESGIWLVARAGTTQDPRLVITFTEDAPPPATATPAAPLFFD